MGRESKLEQKKWIFTNLVVDGEVVPLCPCLGEWLTMSWSLKHFDQILLRRVGLLVELEVKNFFKQ